MNKLTAFALGIAIAAILIISSYLVVSYRYQQELDSTIIRMEKEGNLIEDSLRARKDSIQVDTLRWYRKGAQ